MQVLFKTSIQLHSTISTFVQRYIHKVYKDESLAAGRFSSKKASAPPNRNIRAKTNNILLMYMGLNVELC